MPWLLLPVLPGAACRDAPDPDLWFSVNIAHMRQAQAICQHCPERQPCLDFALAEHIQLGVWGGTLPHERGRPVRRRAAG